MTITSKEKKHSQDNILTALSHSGSASGALFASGVSSFNRSSSSVLSLNNPAFWILSTNSCNSFLVLFDLLSSYIVCYIRNSVLDLFLPLGIFKISLGI